MHTSYADPLRPLARDEMPLPVAFLLSCLLSLALGLTVVVGLRHAVRPVPKLAPMRVVVLQLPSPPAPPPVAAPPDALAPPATPAVILPTTPAGTVVVPPKPGRPDALPLKPPLRTLPRRPAHPHLIEPVMRDPRPAETPASAAIAPAPPATRPSAPDPSARDSLQARIREAIHAVFRYPEAARVMGTHGTTVVGFLYRDRAAFSIHIIQSSLSSILDRAAVSMVGTAELPPPGKLAGQTLSLEVPIVFDLSTDDD